MALSITFLGQAGFSLSDGRSTVLVDPFLTGNPVAVHDPAAIECTHIALTHGHDDHFGADTIAIAQRTGATVIAANEIVHYLREQGLTDLEPGNPGGRIRTDFGSITFTQAFHSSSYEGRYMGPACGLVIEIGGVSFYHAGDTGIFTDMKLIGEIYKPLITALPIGDRFTMGPELASKAAELIGAKYAIPIHYGTFPLLVQTPDAFRPQGVEVHIMEPGDTWEV